jgi:hypothetical protein
MAIDHGPHRPDHACTPDEFASAVPRFVGTPPRLGANHPTCSLLHRWTSADSGISIVVDIGRR